MLWMLLCCGLVFLMQAGFICLESGQVRNKNSINVAIKNITDFCIASTIFWLFGYALMFGDSANGIIGTNHFFFEAKDSNMQIFFLFQMLFCGTATTLLSGAVAERLKFKSYIILSVMTSALIYPVLGHWLWAIDPITKEPAGWLGQLGFIDFAGSTAVHSVGGWIALAAIIVIGPRLGRFEIEHDKRVAQFHGHNLPLACLGTFLLFMGWFGFNGGSALVINDNTPNIILNTAIAGAFGGMAALIYTWIMLPKPNALHIMNGVLAGLVSITATANIMTMNQAIIIGIVGGLLSIYVAELLVKFKLDDAIGVVPVHLAGGIWGTLAVALLGNPTLWGTGLTRTAQLGVQLTGILTAMIWCFIVPYILIRLINQYIPFRVSQDTELIGLNIGEHDAKTELYDMILEMQDRYQQQDFQTPLTVEPYEEVGLIATQYNRILGAFNRELTKRKETEEKLKAAQTDLINNEKMATIGKLTSTVAHELRHPLGTIRNSIYNITQKNTNKTSSLKTNTRRINSSIDRANRIISELEEFTQTHRTPFLEQTRLDDWLTKEIDALNLPSDIKINKSLNSGAIVNIGKKPFGSVIDKLLSNACQSMVASEQNLNNTNILTIKTEIDGDYVSLIIEDTGIGIAEEDMPHIFEPLFSSKSFGVGLSLPIIKQIVDNHKGELSIDSKSGEGTRVRCKLPLYTKPQKLE